MPLACLSRTPVSIFAAARPVQAPPASSGPHFSRIISAISSSVCPWARIAITNRARSSADRGHRERTPCLPSEK